MRPEEFFEALSDIDENIVDKAKPFGEEETVEPIIVTPKKKSFKPFYAAAACLGIIAAGASAVLLINGNRGVDIPYSTDMQNIGSGSSVLTGTDEPAESKVLGQYPDNANFVYTGDFSNLEMLYPICIEYAKYYQSYSELAADSLLVVAGTFVDDTRQTDTEEIDVNKGKYASFNKLKVTKVLKGDVKEGDELIIGDSYAVYDGALQAGTFLTPMIKGDSWVYFLQKSDNATYYSVGGHQGRYPVPLNENKPFLYAENVNGVAKGEEFNYKIYDEIEAIFGTDIPAKTDYSQGYDYAYTGDYSECTDISRPKNILPEHYNSYEELAEDSDLIVHGIFVDDPHQDVDPNSDLPLGTNIFSQCKFKVYDVIKGDAAVGDTIIIAQSTGVYGDKLISTSQLSPMVNRDEWFYFLKRDNYSGVYHAVNDSDGRYPPLYCSTNFPSSILGYDNDSGYTYKEYFNEGIYSKLVEVYEGQTKGDQPQTGCHRIFDAVADKNDFTTEKVTFKMGEYPDVEFGVFDGVEAVCNGTETKLYGGMPVASVYLCDLNGDGKREICSTVAYGSGLIDMRVYAYDYANQKCYLLQDRGNYDFILKEENNKLMVSKCKYTDEIGVNEVSYNELTLNMMSIVTDNGEQNPNTNTDNESKKISFNKNMGRYSVCVDIEAVPCKHGGHGYDLIQNSNNICIKDENGNIVSSRAFPWEMNVYPEADSTDLTFQVLELSSGNVLAMGFPVNVNGTECRRYSFFCFDNSSVSFAGIGDNYNFDETNPIARGDVWCENDCICFSGLNSSGTGFTDCHYLADFGHSCFSHCEGSGSVHHSEEHHSPAVTTSQASQSGHHSENHYSEDHH